MFTLRVYRPGYCQLIAQWIWSSPLTGVNIVGRVWISKKKMRHRPSHNAAATTVTLLVRMRIPETMSKNTACGSECHCNPAVRLATRCLDYTRNRNVGEVAASARRSHYRYELISAAEGILEKTTMGSQGSNGYG
jgi:hypothetical protein